MARIAIAGLSYTESFIMRIVQRISTLLIVYECICSGYAQTDNICGLERFRCRNGECIADKFLCNGIADCKDSSDETEVECKKIPCPDYSFRCNYGGCINKDYVCNGNQDCVDNSDETQLQCRTRTGRKNQTKRSIQCETGSTCNNEIRCKALGTASVEARCTYGVNDKWVSCESPVSPGTKAALDCRNSYRRETNLLSSQRDNVICNANGQWEPEPIQCVPVQSETTQSPPVLTPSPTRSTVTPGTKTCKAPRQPQNGHWKLHRLQCPNERECNVPEGTELEFGSYLIYSCNPGYNIRDLTNVTCSIEGKWLNIPVCIEQSETTQSSHGVLTQYLVTHPTVTPGTKTCKAPPQPQNGHWKLHRLQCPNESECNVPEGTELGLGSYLIYSCNPGYKMRGPTDVICNIEGKWLNIPVCTEIRCEALSTASVEAVCTYDDEWVLCESPVPPGTKAELSCRNSYRRETSLLTSQRNNVICNANGQWEPEPIRCVPVCGALPAEYTPLIINGSRPNITEFPWHASMYRGVPNEPKKFFCGTSIIKENLLITAAHCVYDENTKRVIDANKIYIVTGNIYRDYDSPLHNPRLVKKNQVKNIYIHCNYSGLTGNYMWDIAILELVEPFVLSASLVPICIDTLSKYDYYDPVLQPGIYGKVAGFGGTAVGDTSAILQALTVPYVPFNECNNASRNANTIQFITNDKFCAGYTNGSSICDGDGGSGLVFKTNDLWYLRGIVSVSLGTILDGGTARCGHNSYDLYTKISSHLIWIQDIIARVEQNQTHSLC